MNNGLLPSRTPGCIPIVPVVESQFSAWLERRDESLRRWLTAWEEGCERALLGPMARERHFIEHNVEGLLRGDSKGRADFYKEGIASGWLLKSEARRLENLPAIEGIDHAPTQDAA